MVIPRIFFAGFLLATLAVHAQDAAAGITPGDATFIELTAKYAGAEKRCRDLLEQGRGEEATRVLIDLVPDEERTALHHHLLGSHFFTFDHALSRKFNQIAFEQAPDDSEIVRMWALECQRIGEHDAADRLHARQPEAFWDLNPGMVVVRADNLLRLGRFSEAVRAWRRARTASDDDDIQLATWWIHGSECPDLRRGALMERIRAGEKALVEELLLLDLEWRVGWNDQVVRDKLVRADLTLAAKILGEKSDRYGQLSLMVKMQQQVAGLAGIAQGQKNPGASEFEKALTGLKLLGPGARLAESSLVAHRLLARLMHEQPAKAKELLKAHEAALEKRIAAAGGDAEAFELLLLLARGASDARLETLERTGFEKHHHAGCAVALLARRAESLTREDPDLVKALLDFPEDPRITSLALECERREGRPLLAAVARHLKAGLRHPMDVGSLDRGFDVLEDALRTATPGIQATIKR